MIYSEAKDNNKDQNTPKRLHQTLTRAQKITLTLNNKNHYSQKINDGNKD